MEIIIDNKIRDWVFIPLIFVMFMVGIFRYYLSQYMNNYKVAEVIKSKPQYAELSDNNIIATCGKLVMNNGLISENSFKMRKVFFCKKNGGFLYKHQETKPKDAMAGMMMNNNMLSDMLKNNLSMAVSTMLQFAWVSYFFSGFILAKVPFPLTQKFRGMLQRGVEIQNLDVKYVSSLSLYFLVLFGLHGLQGLILGADSDSEDMKKLNDMQNMNMMGGAPGQKMPGQQPDFNKLFITERENIELIKHKFVMENSQDVLLEKLRKLKNNMKK